MRKRAQRRGPPIQYVPKHIVQKTSMEKKTDSVKKNWWIAATLIGIFLLVLFFNSYFNIASEISINQEGTGLDKYYLSGPDPYYNMRLVEKTMETGEYPFYRENDPLLNYPIGSTGGRPPLLNMMALGFSRLLVPFMDEIDAVGYSMQFVPALFGALIVFPIYYIGKTLFGKKEGLIAALLIALIPIHVASGHGSAYSLFDHDSLNLMLFFLTFLFLIKGIKEKILLRSVLYALLSGVCLGALAMTWVQSQFIFTVITVYVFVQILIDIYTSKYDINVVRVSSITLLSGYLISLPVLSAKIGGSLIDLPLYLGLGVVAVGIAYYILGWKKVPWTISLTTIFLAAIIGLIFLYYIQEISRVLPFFTPLTRLSDILFGSGVYGTKVSMTIAEAGTYNISRTVMSFGPALYWLGLLGFLLLMYEYYKNKLRRDYLFIIVLFFIEIWLAGTAGRFLNDLVPLIAILGGWIVWMVIDKVNYKQMIRNIKSAGGGIHGIRRGVKVFHIFGILFIAFLVVLPNAYLAFDAAVPGTKKEDIFGPDHTSAFGLGHGKEAYWVDGYNWLNKQDLDIEDPTKRPAFISWWDYGFYEAAIGAHPTVADNFQDGIPPAANFHTSTSEQEAVSVWIIRLLRGNQQNNNGDFSEEVIDALEKHVGKNNSNNITKWITDASTAPSYNMPIGEEYDAELSNEWRVGGQYGENAYYHDIVNLLTSELSDEELTWLYHDIQEATGYSIRYYGVEGYDKQIFNIFGFLSDKSLLLVAGAGNNPEDDFLQIKYIMQDGTEATAADINAMSDTDLRANPPVNTKPYYKDAYFDTMFYRTYIGPATGEPGNKQELKYQLPCIGMKHFCAEHISNYFKYAYYEGMSAVVIAKYYEGAYVNGSITFMGNPVDAYVAVQKNISHYETSIPIDHDSAITVNGEFNVTVPAGEIILQIRRYPELGIPVLGGNSFIMKNVTFSDPNSSELAPITEEEAMRKSSDFQRTIEITIDPANVEGYIYSDKDGIEGYNESIDEPIEDAQVTLHEVTEFTEQGAGTILRNILTTDENGYYNASDLMPGLYMVRAEQADFILKDDMISLFPGNNRYDMPKPKLSSVEGTVYYDEEAKEDVNVELVYQKLDLNGNLEKEIKIDSMKTPNDGKYSFSSLMPGQYILNATEFPEYEAEEQITISEGESKIFNITLYMSPVTVSGYTKYGGTIMDNVTIDFLADEDENNTAISVTDIQSNTYGVYSIDLQPGTYNISAEKTVNESGVDVKYTHTSTLIIKTTDVTISRDIVMTREEP